MSTILDALRKAQEDTGGKREQPVGEHPAATEAVVPPRARRRVGWPVAVVAILAVAFAGGLALGDRIVALFGGSPNAPQPAGDVQVAERGADSAPPAAEPAVKQEPAAAAAPATAVRRGRRPAQGESDAGTAPQFAQTADAVVKQPVEAARGEAPEAAPTPYGRLHVFGAGERPAQGNPANDDRLARLQQLREKMLKARQDAAARGTQEDSAPAQIFVPPPRDPAAAQGGGGKVTAPAAAERHDAPAEVARTDAAPAEVARTDPAPAPAAADQGEAAVGVSVTNARAEGAEAAAHDPDIPPPSPAEAAPAAAPEPSVAVAAIPPPAPEPAAVPAAAPAPAAAAAPQVLRRAPGGAPQVAINILQWSAEPGRRFAFVSVDGGNMTQVREGDRIGGLTIKHIHQQMIEFGFNDSTFLLRAN